MYCLYVRVCLYPLFFYKPLFICYSLKQLVQEACKQLTTKITKIRYDHIHNSNLHAVHTYLGFSNCHYFNSQITIVCSDSCINKIGICSGCDLAIMQHFVFVLASYSQFNCFISLQSPGVGLVPLQEI